MATLNPNDPQMDTQKLLLMLQNITQQVANSTLALMEDYQKKITQVINNFNQTNLVIKSAEQSPAKEQPVQKFGKR